MKIGKLDGSLIFETGTVRPDLTRTQLFQTILARGATERITNANEGWRHITIRPETDLAANLVYKGEQLHQVYLLMAIPTDAANEWSTELELQRKTKHDEWLRSELGEPPYVYAWGRLDSMFDEKGCVSEIIVTYAR